MATYSSWSVDALRGYLVMAEALMSGTTSSEMLGGYQTKIRDVETELQKRAEEHHVSRSLAFPTETVTTGSAGG